MKTKLKYKTRVSFSKHFQKFQNGEIVAVIKKPSVTASFPGRLHGQTGVIDGKVGKAYVVRINGVKNVKALNIFWVFNLLFPGFQSRLPAV